MHQESAAISENSGDKAASGTKLIAQDAIEVLDQYESEDYGEEELYDDAGISAAVSNRTSY